MKLYTNLPILLKGDDPVQIYKNNGKKVAVVTLRQVRDSLRCIGAQVVIESGSKRFGAMRDQIVSFLNDNTNEYTDFSTTCERMKSLRGV